ncbi:hypothetical protein SAMN05660209_04558 [Geodermatophilus africanus]|uniref:Uncharacterized protein n=1 Tax=Geodermatophilus africanus TaxID=1137993 RepID=A0A1H3Q187_9ACTN|nr:hypothetical protein SAMN05660209_04558 [Geodermatophilus africanus]
MSGGHRRWIFAGVTALVLIGALVGELRDPPFDLVRFLFQLVLGGLTAWLLVWLFTRPFSLRGND